MWWPARTSTCGKPLWAIHVVLQSVMCDTSFRGCGPSQAMHSSSVASSMQSCTNTSMCCKDRAHYRCVLLFKYSAILLRDFPELRTTSDRPPSARATQGKENLQTWVPNAERGVKEAEQARLQAGMATSRSVFFPMLAGTARSMMNKDTARLSARMLGAWGMAQGGKGPQRPGSAAAGVGFSPSQQRNLLLMTARKSAGPAGGTGLGVNLSVMSGRLRKVSASSALQAAGRGIATGSARRPTASDHTHRDHKHNSAAENQRSPPPPGRQAPPRAPSHDP